MEQNNISPEERLLRIIRKSDTSFSREKPRVKKEDTKREGFFHKFSLRIHKLRLNKMRVLPLLRSPSKILLVIIIILGVYLVLDFFISRPQRDVERILKHKPGVEEELLAGSSQPDALAAKPLSFFTRPAQLRNLFTAIRQPREETPGPTFMERVAQFRVKGIISGVNPQAIIEDTKSGQLYFLSEGDRIGDIEIKEILPGKVRLGYHGQEVELAL